MTTGAAHAVSGITSTAGSKRAERPRGAEGLLLGQSQWGRRQSSGGSRTVCNKQVTGARSAGIVGRQALVA